MSLNDKNRLITDSDLTHFHIPFESVLNHQPTFECFLNYLNTSHNDEVSKFLKYSVEFKQLKTQKERLQKAFEIYQFFIQDGSIHQLNLNSNIRQKIKEVIFEKANTLTLEEDNTDTLSTCSTNSGTSSSEISSSSNINSSSNNIPSSLFTKAENYLLLNLKETKFNDFLQSKIFKKYMKEKPLQFLYDIGTLKETSHFKLIENLCDITREVITFYDFKFVKEKMNSDNKDDWELIDSGKNYKTYLSADTFNFGSSNGVNFCKFEIIFPYEAKNVMKTILEVDYRLQYDGTLTNVQEIKYINKPNTQNEKGNTQFATGIFMDTYHFGWPITDRELLMCCSAVYDKKEKSYLFVGKSCNCKEAPIEKKDPIRGVCISGWKFKEDYDPITLKPFTKFCQLFYLDLKGKIPRILVYQNVKKRAKNFYKIGLKYLKIHEKKGFVTINDTKAMEMVEENGAIEI
ncbi:hypothetical protein ABK040_012298 [Willaertia magna]